MAARVTRGTHRFDHPALQPYDWPHVAIEAPEPGSRLCIMAGMHINEVSSMEAACRLVEDFGHGLERGRVDMLPIVNVPGLFEHSIQVCPVDGRNINFCFPGDPNGTFSAVLADALLRWAGDADLLIDMHGADIIAQVAFFTMCQRVGKPAFDAATVAFAHGYDADVHVVFEPGQTSNVGRACNERPRLGRHAVMSEAGGNGLVDPAAVEFHRRGALACAARLGMMAPPDAVPARANLDAGAFTRVSMPADGRVEPVVALPASVRTGDVLGRLRDLYGRPMGELASPVGGTVIFRQTHPIARAGDWVFIVAHTDAGAGA